MGANKSKIDWGQFGTNMISSVGNGIIGGLIGLGTTALQHKYNKELADKQFEQNVSMWNMQNEYNSPVAQRQRLEDAGLNPALLYGNGGGSTGNASQMPQYQAFGQSISQNMLQGAQIANLVAQARLTNAQADKQESENPYAGATAEAQLDLLLADKEVKKTTVRQMEKGIAKMDVEINKLNQEIKVMETEISLKIAQTHTEETKAKLNEAQEALVILQQSLTIAQTNTENERTHTQKAQTDYTNAQTATAKAQKDLLISEKALTDQKLKTEINNTRKVYEESRKTYAEYIYKIWETEYSRTTGRKVDANMEQFILTVLGRAVHPRKGGWQHQYDDWQGKKIEEEMHAGYEEEKESD